MFWVAVLQFLRTFFH